MALVRLALRQMPGSLCLGHSDLPWSQRMAVSAGRQIEKQKSQLMLKSELGCWAREALEDPPLREVDLTPRGRPRLFLMSGPLKFGMAKGLARWPQALSRRDRTWGGRLWSQHVTPPFPCTLRAPPLPSF